MLFDDVKNYIRVTDTDDDLQIQSLIDAAEIYLRNAGAVITDGSLYSLAVKILVSHWFDNREPVGDTKKLAFGLGDIIAQLKYCGDET